ncbi:hypothetical protein C8J57DRAFT_208927 [Mycena rebaudengoi]|nr:hypothetical protein C8J57DRAFT_208927 [Mycena rebaudengoi]
MYPFSPRDMLDTPPPSPARLLFLAPDDPESPRSLSSPPYFIHDAEYDSDFYRSHLSDAETGRLVPSDRSMPDLASNNKNRRMLYAAYRRWFARGSPSDEKSKQHLIPEKGFATETEQSSLKVERRIQLGSCLAVLVLLSLTIWFVRREL